MNRYCNIADETKNSLQQFLPPYRRQGTIDTDNSLVLKRAGEGSRQNHDKSTPHRSETDGDSGTTCSTGQKRENSMSVGVQSGLSDGWWSAAM